MNGIEANLKNSISKMPEKKSYLIPYEILLQYLKKAFKK